MASEIINNAVAGPESVPVAPGIGGVPAGLDPSSPDAQKALSDYGRSAGYIGKSLATGMAQGTQAAQGATNPLSAFMQGMSAGLQAPAQVFQAKRNQIQSAFEATPFGVTHAQLIKDHPELSILAGMPTGLAMPAIATIAIQSAKVYEETKAAKSLKAEDFKYKQAEIGLKGKDPMSIKDQIDLRKNFEGIEAVKQYQIAAPSYEMIINSEPGIGDKVAVIKFAQMLNPTVRVNDQTMDSMDASGTLDKFTADAWRKAKTGAILGPEERSKLIKEATKIYNQRSRDFHEVASVVREQASNEGFNPAHIVNESPIETVERLDKNGNRVLLQKMKDGTFRKVN